MRYAMKRCKGVQVERRFRDMVDLDANPCASCQEDPPEQQLLLQERPQKTTKKLQNLHRLGKGLHQGRPTVRNGAGDSFKRSV